MTPLFIIVGARNGAYYAHTNRVSGKLYTYTDQTKAAAKAAEMMRKDTALNCQVVPIMEAP